MTTITEAQRENMMKNSQDVNKNRREAFKNIKKNLIVDAFIEGDECKLIDLHSSYPSSPFYKMLGLGVLPKVNVNMSYLMKSILSAKINLLWGTYKFTGDVITKEFITDLEDSLQRYGEAIVKPIYDNKFVTSFEIITNYYKEDWDNDTFIEHYTYESYTHNDATYDLKTIYKDNKQIHEVYYKAEILNYNSWPSIFLELEEELTYSHNSIYEFTQQVTLKDIIPINNTIDLIGTNIDWTIKNGKMMVIYSKSLAMRNADLGGNAKSIDEQDPDLQIADSYGFFVKDTYLKENLQNQKETVQPDLSSLTILGDLKDKLIVEAGNIMGISSLTLGKELNISAASSSDTLKQRDVLSTRTKISERANRLSILDKMIKDLNLSDRYEDSEDIPTVDIEWAKLWFELRKSGDITRAQLMKKLNPHWTPKQVKFEELSRLKEKALGLTNVK